MTWKTANQKMFKKWYIIFWTSLATAMIYIITVTIRLYFSYYQIPNSIDMCAGFVYGTPVKNQAPGAWFWGSYLFTINFSGFLSDIFLIRFFHLRQKKTQPLQLGPVSNTCKTFLHTRDFKNR